MAVLWLLQRIRDTGPQSTSTSISNPQSAHTLRTLRIPLSVKASGASSGYSSHVCSCLASSLLCQTLLRVRLRSLYEQHLRQRSRTDCVYAVPTLSTLPQTCAPSSPVSVLPFDPTPRPTLPPRPISSMRLLPLGTAGTASCCYTSSHAGWLLVDVGEGKYRVARRPSRGSPARHSYC